MFCKDSLVVKRDDPHKHSENVRKTFHKTLQEHSRLTFSELFVFAGSCQYTNFTSGFIVPDVH